MNKKKVMLLLIGILVLAISALYIYNLNRSSPKNKLYQTTQPSKKTIKKDIRTRGTLAIRNTSKIGSLVTGTVKKIYVQEHDHVTKGQLLLEIDNGKGASEVTESRGEVMQAQAKHDYLKQHITRQKKLFDAGQLAQDKYEEKMRDFHDAEGALISKRAKLEKKTIEYNNTRIYAPQDGTITKIGVSEGERVTTDLNATILFEIAEDAQSMVAQLHIDEAHIGQIQLDQPVKLVIDAYPHFKIQGKIIDIAGSPKKEESNTYYLAMVALEPVSLKLFPGMKINAKISLAKAKDVLSLPATAFLIDHAPIKRIAQIEKLAFEPLDRQEKKRLKLRAAEKPLLFAWVRDNNKIKETPVTCGLSDYATYQVCSGVHDHEHVIIDVQEPNEMKSTYQKLFKSAI